MIVVTKTWRSATQLNFYCGTRTKTLIRSINNGRDFTWRKGSENQRVFKCPLSRYDPGRIESQSFINADPVSDGCSIVLEIASDIASSSDILAFFHKQMSKRVGCRCVACHQGSTVGTIA